MRAVIYRRLKDVSSERITRGVKTDSQVYQPCRKRCWELHEAVRQASWRIAFRGCLEQRGPGFNPEQLDCDCRKVLANIPYSFDAVTYYISRGDCG